MASLIPNLDQYLIAVGDILKSSKQTSKLNLNQLYIIEEFRFNDKKNVFKVKFKNINVWYFLSEFHYPNEKEKLLFIKTNERDKNIKNIINKKSED